MTREQGRWHVTTVRSILSNEKFKGEALLQKTVGVDFLEKTHKANEGEAPQYRVTNSHEAIIRPEVFDLAQSMLREYREREGIRNCAHAFSSRVVCGECGGQYGVKAWRSSKNGQPITRHVWQCNKKYKARGKVNCHTPHLTEQVRPRSRYLQGLRSPLA